MNLLQLQNFSMVEINAHFIRSKFDYIEIKATVVKTETTMEKVKSHTLFFKVTKILMN